MIPASKLLALKSTLLEGTRISAAAVLAKVSKPTALTYLKLWQADGSIPIILNCRCGKPIIHVGSCPGARRKTTPAPLPVKPFTAHHTETEWGQMLIQIRPEILAYSLKELRHKSHAEDLVSQTIEKAWRSRLLYTKDTNFKGWIYTCLKNNLNGNRRGKYSQKTVDIDSTHISTAEQTTTTVLANEVIVKIARLNPEQRDVCFCVWLDGMSYEETARRYGVSIGTIKSRLWRVREKLRGRLESAVSPGHGKDTPDQL